MPPTMTLPKSAIGPNTREVPDIPPPLLEQAQVIAVAMRQTTSFPAPFGLQVLEQSSDPSSAKN